MDDKIDKNVLEDAVKFPALPTISNGGIVIYTFFTSNYDKFYLYLERPTGLI